MPILDVEIVLSDGHAVPDNLAAQIADAAGKLFGSPPGTTWVRLRPLPRSCYAENDAPDPEGWNAVFVTVLKARLPATGELEPEIRSLTEIVADLCGRKPENVHVLYLPDAAGRIAFGGRLRR
jgi:phenylpyruvate tautomerase PptA (4-oxalocrotonate tautomerase family)